METAKPKARATLHNKARRFCAWRKKQGGSVVDLRREARGSHREMINRSNSQDAGILELDVIFERNQRYGRLA